MRTHWQSLRAKPSHCSTLNTPTHRKAALIHADATTGTRRSLGPPGSGGGQRRRGGSGGGGEGRQGRAGEEGQGRRAGEEGRQGRAGRGGGQAGEEGRQGQGRRAGRGRGEGRQGREEGRGGGQGRRAGKKGRGGQGGGRGRAGEEGPDHTSRILQFSLSRAVRSPSTTFTDRGSLSLKKILVKPLQVAMSNSRARPGHRSRRRPPGHLPLVPAVLR